jgi:hypothetical protein
MSSYHHIITLTLPPSLQLENPVPLLSPPLLLFIFHFPFHFPFAFSSSPLPVVYPALPDPDPIALLTPRATKN